MLPTTPTIRRRPQKLDRPADRILSREVLPGRCLVDDHDGFAALAVVVCKERPLSSGTLIARK